MEDGRYVIYFQANTPANAGFNAAGVLVLADLHEQAALAIKANMLACLAPAGAFIGAGASIWDDGTCANSAMCW